MKRAIRVPGALSPEQIHFEKVMKEVWNSTWGRHLSDNPDYGYNRIATEKLPEYLYPSVDLCLSRLNEVSRNIYTLHPRTPERTLIFGWGSVPTHDDDISGKTLLTFLGGFRTTDSPNESDRERELFHEGELYTAGHMTRLKTGESVIFDDRESHSWMHNSGWVFMSAAIKVNYSRKTLSKGVK
jgi:hypothetical protein